MPNQIRNLFTMKISLLVVTSILLLSSVELPAQSSQENDFKAVYVSSSATTGGDGTLARPFRLLSEAENATGPHDTVFLIAKDNADLIDGAITLKPGQKLLGIGADGKLIESINSRVKLTNSSTQNDGYVVRVSNNNEIAGIHFIDIGNSAITNATADFSNTHVHHATFSGTASDHVADERGLLYAVTFNAENGLQSNIRIEDSLFVFGLELGAIYVSHGGSSRADYLFQRNDFSDLGGRPYFIQTRGRSKVETTILDSTADNIGRGDQNSDSIIPWLMGESEQVMLVRNYHYKNSDQVGNVSNTGLEVFVFGEPRPDPDNWCVRCKLTLKILDSVFENTVTDAIQFTNFGVNSDLHYEIRNTRIIGGNPQQGGGAISLNVQNKENSASRTSLLVENTDIIGSKGYGFSMNDSGFTDGYTVTLDFGGGVLGSKGNNKIIANERGAVRIAPVRMSATGNWWSDQRPTVFNSQHEPFEGANIDFQPMLTRDPRQEK